MNVSGPAPKCQAHTRDIIVSVRSLAFGVACSNLTCETKGRRETRIPLSKFAFRTEAKWVGCHYIMLGHICSFRGSPLAWLGHGSIHTAANFLQRIVTRKQLLRFSFNRRLLPTLLAMHVALAQASSPRRIDSRRVSVIMDGPWQRNVAGMMWCFLC